MAWGKQHEFKLPNSRERVAVFGRTGSGKTVFMTFLLSRASITERPWIIIDHKNDDYLTKLPYAEQIKLGTLPKYPGLYIVKPSFQQDEEVDAYLHSILRKGNIGVFTDEGSSIKQAEPRFTGLKSIFAQGRSKRTPILFATQRPAWINKSVLSESDYFACFHLQTQQDKDRVHDFMTILDEETPLDRFHCHWYDVKQDRYFRLSPVNEQETLQVLEDRLKPDRCFL